MPLLTKEELRAALVASIGSCGWHVASRRPPEERPCRLRVVLEDRSIPLKVYIWNLTHGGGTARPANEYRIQVTGVESFEAEPDGATLILGWWDEVQVYAAFDVDKHVGELGFSPSIQIREQALREAYERGLATHTKHNQEIAVAFRPELLMHYVENRHALHSFGESEHDAEILNAVAADPYAVAQDAIESVQEPRRRTVQTTQRVLRDRSFRDRVLNAYGHRCAVCSVQLGLVEAAHIVPAALETSTDATCNGMSFCPSHHKAYDWALITVDDEYRVLVSESRVHVLDASNLTEGLDAFRAGLRPLIVLPPEPAQQPRIENLRQGRDIRGWQE